jgi:DNA polymerase-3 subunit delta'
MAWHGIEGHDEIVERFRRILAGGRLAHAYLFIGPEGVGKRLFAQRLAQALLCTTRGEQALDPCGACPACRQVMAGTHPDLLVVQKPPDKAAIPLELLIGSGEKRMREGLCHDIGLKSFAGRRKIAIIDDADFLNVEGANCLLKTLEEPPPQSLLILIGTSLQRQLPTIRSRSQVVRFDPLPDAIVVQLLVQSGQVADADEAARLARYAEGSLAQAAELNDPQLWEFRGHLLKVLSQPRLDSVRAANSLAAFVERAGSEASRRRDRLRQVIRFAIEYYCNLLRTLSGASASAERQLAEAIERRVKAGPPDMERVVASIETSLAALEYVDRNVNQTTVLQWWLDELGKHSRLPVAPGLA